MNYYGQGFVDILAIYPQYLDDIIKNGKQRGDYFINRLIEESKKGDSAVERFIQNTSKKGTFNRLTQKETASFNYQVESFLKSHNYTLEDFNRLRLKSVDSYTASEITLMMELRNSIPAPTKSTLMSKVIPYNSIEDYTSGRYNTITGFITKADDVTMCKSYMDYYNKLRLDYTPANYLPETDNALVVIRFSTDEINKIQVPYSTENGWNGYCEENPPFVGNGFTGAVDDTFIPEYWCYDNASQARQFCKITNGAEMYLVTQDGEEILWAVYNGKMTNPQHPETNGCFVKLEDMN